MPILAAPRRLLAQSPSARALSFTHTHTGERLAVEYFSGGDYLPDALATVNHFLRDFRTEEVHAIDPGLLDLFHGLTGLTRSTRPFQVISGDGLQRPTRHFGTRAKGWRQAACT